MSPPLFRRCEAAATLTLVVSLLVAVVAGEAVAQDTADYFRANCKACHTIGGGPLSGPDLKDVTERKDREWLIRFMRDPKAVIDSGDEYAQKIWKDSREVYMPALPGVAERGEELLNLIEAESKLEQSQFKGLPVSDRPFTDEDRKKGRQIFLGMQRLEAGGAACISCHSMHDTPTLGGGRLVPEKSDLTQVFGQPEHRDRKAFSNWLADPPSPNMKAAFRDHRLTADEVHALVAYFEDASKRGTAAQPVVARIAFLLSGLAGAVVLIFSFDAIWKRRFHAVRRPLVDANATRGH
ncbi:MAG: cytochrome c [Planctomycetota bacterium]|nr:MAG: cytochrome c [Planctomycetota bacterium]